MTDWSRGQSGGVNPNDRPEDVDPEAPTDFAPQYRPPSTGQRGSSPGQPGPGAPAPSSPQWTPPPPAAPRPWAGNEPQAGAPAWGPPGQSQPWQGTPPPPQQPPPGGPGYGQQFGPGGPPPGKSRKPLFISLAAGGALIVVIGIVFAITTAGGGSKGGSAADAVQGYLEALSRGDAEAALAYSNDQPASKELLTDEVLQKQIAKWPISDIRILNDDSKGSIGMGSVHVAAKFGEKVSDANLQVKKEGGEWKLDAAAIKIQADIGGNNEAAKSLTLFGKKAGGDAVYVFPGYLDGGSTSDYVKVEIKPLLLDKLNSYGFSTLDAEYTLTDDGTDAVMAQLKDAFANCERSNLLSPPGCPTKMTSYGLVDGTAVWGPADLSGVTTDNFNQYDMTVSINGKAVMPFSARTTDGDTRSGPASAYIFSKADMTKTPPALDFR